MVLAQWRTQPKNLGEAKKTGGWAKIFNVRWITVFSLEYLKAQND